MSKWFPNFGIFSSGTGTGNDRAAPSDRPDSATLVPAVLWSRNQSFSAGASDVAEDQLLPFYDTGITKSFHKDTVFKN